MEQRRKNLTQLFIPICLETLLYMLSGMVDTLMLSSVMIRRLGRWELQIHISEFLSSCFL